MTDYGRQEKIWVALSTPAVPLLPCYAFNTADESDLELEKKKKKLAYRHIAWLYTFREQLLVPTEWETSVLRNMGGECDQKA